MKIYAAGFDPATTSEHWFYDHTERLIFDKRAWAYYHILPDGSRRPLLGVTSVLKKVIDKSAPLSAWAVKVDFAKLKSLLTVIDGRIDISEFEFDQLCEQAKKTHREEFEEAGDIGSQAHAWIEAYIRAILADNADRRLELLSKLPLDDRAANCCLAALEWMANHNVRWVCTERKVFSREHGYAGTLDGLARVDSCDNLRCCQCAFKDQLSIIDWKSSNALRLDYVFQAAGAYRHAYVEETGAAIAATWIIRLGKELADFDPWYLTDDYFPGFLNAIKWYRSIVQLENFVGDIKDERAAIQAEIDRLAKDAADKLCCPKAATYKGVRKSKCLADGSQCVACEKIYTDKHESS